VKTVISASRRTDIPAFYSDWFLEQVRQGYADVPNPVVHGQFYRVSLRPDDVHTIVFWSKDFGPLVARIGELQQYRLFFLFTINDCPELEPRVPDLGSRLNQAAHIAARFGPERLAWRFDPIVFWDRGTRHNTRSFGRIAEALADVGVTRCIFSFCCYYRRVRERLKRLAFPWYEPTLQEKRETAHRLVGICRETGMTLYSCCSDEVLDVPGVHKSHCIDGELLSRLAGEPASIARDTSQRKNCGCTRSRDIGDYCMTCYHRCLYCYASSWRGEPLA